MITAKEVAEYFLHLGKDADEPVSNLKIQKLCYYAQGLHLALKEEPLFEEELQAWTHGPVCPVLYNTYKAYASGGITPDKSFEAKSIPRDVRDFLEEVYEVYGQFSAWKLREMTHNEAPWNEAHAAGINTVICHEDMKVFFKGQLVQ